MLEETDIVLVPLGEFSARYARGWRMVPGYPLEPGDYAVTMKAPDFPKPKSNKSRGATSRNETVSKARWAKAKDRLEYA